MIEIASSNIQVFRTYYSSTLKVRFDLQKGELKVFSGVTNLPLSRTYIKVFCLNTDGREVFYKDGFTDIRGKFEYAQTNGDSLSRVQRFSVLVSHDEFGQLIKEVEKPKV